MDNGEEKHKDVLSRVVEVRCTVNLDVFAWSLIAGWRTYVVIAPNIRLWLALWLGYMLQSLAVYSEYSLYESLCVCALLSSTTKAGPPCPSCTPNGARPARATGSCGRDGCLHVRPAAAWWGATASLPPAQWSAVPTTPTSQRSPTAAKTWLPPR